MLKHIQIFIDSCGFYPPVRDEQEAILELLKLEEQDIIQLQITQSVVDELNNAPESIRKYCICRVIAESLITTNDERNTLQKIENVIFPDKAALKKNEQYDVEHIFCAQKYGCRYFVTYDKKHIISKRDVLKAEYGLNAVTPIECLALINDEILRTKRYKERRKE